MSKYISYETMGEGLKRRKPRVKKNNLFIEIEDKLTEKRPRKHKLLLHKGRGGALEGGVLEGGGPAYDYLNKLFTEYIAKPLFNRIKKRGEKQLEADRKKNGGFISAGFETGGFETGGKRRVGRPRKVGRPKGSAEREVRKRKNPWVDHVKMVAMEYNLTYGQALRDPRTKATYVRK